MASQELERRRKRPHVFAVEVDVQRGIEDVEELRQGGSAVRGEQDPHDVEARFVSESKF